MEEVGSATPHPPTPRHSSRQLGTQGGREPSWRASSARAGRSHLDASVGHRGKSPERPFLPLGLPCCPWASLRPRSPCHRRPGQGCMNCWGGKDGARKGKSVFSRGIRESTQMERTPARCSHLGDESLFMARTEGLGVRGVISLRLPYGQRCLCP